MASENEVDSQKSEIAINKYRISQLEEEIKKLEKSSETLKFSQIKQMLLYLGVPVAITTGVFGLALWQIIETSAGNRAALEVQDIGGDIEKLEARSTQMSRDAEVRFGDLREIAGRADEAARAVRTRADEARVQATEAERLLINMRAELARVPEIQTLLQDTGTIATDLAANTSFRNTVASAVLEGLAGSVLAFERECPTELGWVPFDPGQGRMIVGVGSTQDERDETRSFSEVGDIGGEFQHVLAESEMPGHRHPVTYSQGGNANGSGVSYHLVNGDQESATAMVGGNSPHNNMPPYISLFFCKKDIITMTSAFFKCGST